MSVAIGVHAHAEPQGLRATLEFLLVHTDPGFEVILLPDGADAALRAYLQRLQLRQLATAESRGAAACFNRLIRATDAEIVVLLESGSLVGPGWLERLIRALHQDNSTGLAGPSTNLAWNEQCVFPRSGHTPDAVASTAKAATSRFGVTTRSTAPLHSLADFCYAVRREVIDAIGEADEGYGLGPCWEIDYTTRAARAGFRSVWVCGAYVHRLPFTPRRKQEEARLFEASRRRYQDRFCGLRLRGERTGATYEPHCRGDACEHFAPQNLIQTVRCQPAQTRQTVEPAPASAPETAEVVPRSTSQVQVTSPPLVSCIMPTRNRPGFVGQAITMFARQDYPERELIIVDDEDASAHQLERELTTDPRVRYFQLPIGTSIGAKRNFACKQARGAIFAQWDDDDWFGSHRLSAQVEPILSGQADITGLSMAHICDVERNAWWTCSPELHRRLFLGDVHGGTLVFSLRVWTDLSKYPDRSLAEDALFLREALRRGARLRRMDGAGLFVYVRHGGNSWSFTCGSYLGATGWQRVSPPQFSTDEDQQFFNAVMPSARGREGQPLVSCIMPTSNRRAWVPYAIEYFLRQDYPRRELVIVDDGTESVQQTVPSDDRIKYVRLPARQVIGQKRNTCIEHAGGDLIMHWDDDDWIAANRISAQVEALHRGNGDVCGLRRLLHHELGASPDQTWLYHYPSHLRPWVLGNTLLYTRSFWRKSPFPNVNAGEDARFLFSRPLDHLVVLPETTLDLYVAMVHPTNTSPKVRSAPFWSRWPGDIRTILGADAGRYVAASHQLRVA
jgi:glycosyltransferase involved in cell wall biosynthesis